MAFEITLYNCTTDVKGINKNLDDYLNIQGVNLKEDTSILTPTLLLTMPQGRNISEFNYCEVPIYNRFYFIQDIVQKQGNMYEISCRVDVLETYKQYYLERECYIDRCEIKFKENQGAMTKFFDNEYPIRSDVNITTVDVGIVGSGTTYFLTVNGGVQ